MLLDALGAFEDMPSWDDAADNLFNAGLTLNPSALHGAMAATLTHSFLCFGFGCMLSCAARFTNIKWIRDHCYLET